MQWGSLGWTTWRVKKELAEQVPHGSGYSLLALPIVLSKTGDSLVISIIEFTKQCVFSITIFISSLKMSFYPRWQSCWCPSISTFLFSLRKLCVCLSHQHYTIPPSLSLCAHVTKFWKRKEEQECYEQFAKSLLQKEGCTFFPTLLASCWPRCAHVASPPAPN